MLTFLEGDVATPPYPEWAQTDAALASPRGGPVLCHNDVCLENVVFHDGVAVGLIDFDYAAPGRGVYDLAQFAKMCVPLDRPANIATLGWHMPDQVGRLVVIADAYGVAPEGRSEFLSAIDDAMSIGAAFVERHFAAGEPGFVAMVERSGGLERWEKQRRWWHEHFAEFEAALLART